MGSEHGKNIGYIHRCIVQKYHYITRDLYYTRFTHGAGFLFFRTDEQYGRQI